MGGIISFILGYFVGGIFGMICTALFLAASDDIHE